MGPGLSGSGDLEALSVDADNGLGWATEVGMHWHGALVFDVLARYTMLELQFAGLRAASSFMVLYKAYLVH